MRAITMPAGIITIIATNAPAGLGPSRPDGKNRAPQPALPGIVRDYFCGIGKPLADKWSCPAANDSFRSQN
jgi:hypothetical protein